MKRFAALLIFWLLPGLFCPLAANGVTESTSTRLAAQEFRLYLDNLRFIYTHPVGTPIPAGGAPILSANPAKKPVLEAFEETAEEIGSSAGTSAFQAAKELLDDVIDNSPNIKSSAATLARFHQCFGLLKIIMSGRFDDEIATQFTKFFDKRLLKASGEDLFDEWLVALHTHHTTGERVILDQISEDAKDRIVLFLKEPNAFSPWKTGFQSPGNFGDAARGNLVQGPYTRDRWAADGDLELHTCT